MVAVRMARAAILGAVALACGLTEREPRGGSIVSTGATAGTDQAASGGRASSGDGGASSLAGASQAMGGSPDLAAEPSTAESCSTWDDRAPLSVELLTGISGTCNGHAFSVGAEQAPAWIHLPLLASPLIPPDLSFDFSLASEGFSFVLRPCGEGIAYLADGTGISLEGDGSALVQYRNLRVEGDPEQGIDTETQPTATGHFAGHAEASGANPAVDLEFTFSLPATFERRVQ
jgi:hypothetical protein